MTAALASLSTLVAVAFTAATFDRWRSRRNLHDACWSISLAMFAIASGALWYGVSRGWSAPSFRIFYLFGGALNVPWLAAGVVTLLFPRRSRGLVAVLALASAWATGVIGSVALRTAVPESGLPEGRDVFGVLPRVIVAVGSGVAATTIIGLAIWSAVRLRAMPGQGHRALGNVVIAVGTIILSASGTFSAQVGELRSFAITLALGVTTLFAGFLIVSGSRLATPRSAKQAAQDLAVYAAG